VGALALLTAASSVMAAPQVAWRTDLAAARAEALQTRKPLLVVFHQVGEPGNEAMLRTVYGHKRFVAAAEKVIPVLACHFAAGDEAQVASDFGVPASELARLEIKAREFVLGSADVLTPQHVLFHPEGGVLWHNVRTCSLQQLLNGMYTARRYVKKTASARRRLALESGASLAKRAKREPESAVKLSVLMRHSDPKGLGGLVSGVRDSKLCDLVLRRAMHGMNATAVEDRMHQAMGVVRPTQRPMLKRIEHDMIILAAPPVEVREVKQPLPVLGKIEDFSRVRFFDGEVRTPGDKSSELTVLWFFLSGDKSEDRQIEALRPVVSELAGQGVRFLGLGAALQPDAALADAGAAGFPFPVGTFAFGGGEPFGGVDMFPAVLILDRDGNIIHRSGDEMDRDWVSFAPLVRGMLASEHYSRR